MTLHFTAELWQYQGPASWYFVTLPTDWTAEFKRLIPKNLKGFGSIAVQVRCQDCQWKTSIFPDRQRGAYLLPIKAAIRQKLAASIGTELPFELTILL